MSNFTCVTPEQLRAYKRWLTNLEAMLWSLQTAPLHRGKANREQREEEIGLCRYLKELAARGRELAREPLSEHQLRELREDYQCAVRWFFQLQEDRDDGWKL